MSKDMFMGFIVNHKKDYNRIGNYAKKHNITISLGEYPNSIIIDENNSMFQSYVKRYCKDFSVIIK